MEEKRVVVKEKSNRDQTGIKQGLNIRIIPFLSVFNLYLI